MQRLWRAIQQIVKQRWAAPGTDAPVSSDIGSLEITDIELAYSRHSRREALRWEQIQSIIYAESPLGVFHEDHWVFRASSGLEPVTVPDHPELTHQLLEWCSRKLSGFDVSAHVKGLAAAGPYKSRDAVIIECWQRTDPSNSLLNTDARQEQPRAG